LPKPLAKRVDRPGVSRAPIELPTYVLVSASPELNGQVAGGADVARDRLAAPAETVRKSFHSIE